jgi:putative membrane protein
MLEGVFGLIIRWLIIAASVAVAAWAVPGIHVEDDRGTTAVLIMAAVLAVLNMLVKPVLTALSCCLIVLTLGLFLLVVNTAVFYLSARIADDWFDAGFFVDDWLAAFFGALIVSFVSWVLTGLLSGD